MSRYGRLRVVATLCPILSLGAAGEIRKEDAARPVIPVRQSTYALKPFGTVTVYRPAGEPRGLAIFFSGQGGWDGGSEALARSVAEEGLLVAGVSTPVLLKAMEHSGKCVDPNYPIVDLARDVQHRMGVRSYSKPVVIGEGTGATLVYGAISQWSNASYLGAVSVGFGPTIKGHVAWCKAPGFVVKRPHRSKAAWQFVSNKQVRVPWTVIQGADEKGYGARQALAFVAGVPHATLVQVPGTSRDVDSSGQWAMRLKSAVTAFLPPPIPPSQPGQVPVPDMPITLVPATGPGPRDVMAVIYSGDGGWAGIDRDVAGQLATVGIPTVGIDSLSYFWSARTPKGAGADLSQLVNAFSQRWNRPKVLLIGYSFGADAMPYMMQNMTAEARGKVVSLSLLGLSSTADFQFHMTSWLDVASADSLPTIPAIARLKGMAIRCVRGVTEDESACPSIPKGVAQQFVVPGDHHFNRNAPLLVHIILGQRRPGAVSN